MPRLRPCIITCLTILDEPALLPAGPGQVSLYAERLQRCFLHDPRGDKQFERRSCFLGPHYLRVTPIDSEANSAYPVGLLFHALMDLVFANANLGRFQLPASGVVTFGTVLDDRQVFVGHGITQALAEQKIAAGLPRIVVSPHVLFALEQEPLLRKDTHTLAQERGYLRPLLFRDRDGLWVLDPLGAMADQCADDEEYGQLLRECAETLRKGLRKAKKADTLDDRARALGWLRRYHNRTVDRFFHGLKSQEAPTVGPGADAERSSEGAGPSSEAAGPFSEAAEPTIGGRRRAELRVPRIGPICYSF